MRSWKIALVVLGIAFPTAFIRDLVITSALRAEGKTVTISTPQLSKNTSIQNVSYKTSNKSHIILSLDGFNPKDRMGSRVQLAVGAWALAKANGYQFCSPPDPAVEILGFPICNATLDTLPRYPFRKPKRTASTGVYLTPHTKADRIWTRIEKQEGRTPGFVWGDATRNEWNHMILNAAGVYEPFWKNDSSVRKIAVSIRRGDVTPDGKWYYRFIPDQAYLSLIQKCRSMFPQNEVHVFSEDYGATNWTAYHGIVDFFHLAPKGQSDLMFNLRDWAHFLKADILIAGGTFSIIPALGRSEPGNDGLPMTIFFRNNYGYLSSGFHPKHWVSWFFGKNGTVELTLQL